MQVKLILAATLLLTGILKADPVPTPFANQYSANFVEDMWIPLRGHQNTTGTWYYDWTNKKFWLDRQDSANDRYCGVSEGFKHTSCSMIITGGRRYLYYPELKYCCFCCKDNNGCGMVYPNWFAGAEFKGLHSDSQWTYNTWNAIGLQSNYVSQIYGGPYDGYTYKIYQDPESNMVFDPTSYKFDLDPSVFDLPQGLNCQQFCPTISLCTAMRRRHIHPEPSSEDVTQTEPETESS